MWHQKLGRAISVEDEADSTKNGERKETAMREINYSVIFSAMLVSSMALSAQSHERYSFSTASLTGAYSTQEQGDGSVSAGLGVVRYDGTGKTTRRVLGNAPAENGSRRTLVFESEGTYSLNSDGTGTATYLHQHNLRRWNDHGHL
jgi:hypothetical protein